MFKSQLEPPSENFVETQIFVENIFDTVKKAREAKAARSLAESKLATSYDYAFDFSPSKRKKQRKNAKNKSGKKIPTPSKKKQRKPRTPKDKSKLKQQQTPTKTPRKYTKRAKIVPPKAPNANDIDDEEAAFILSSISQRSFDSFYNRLNVNGSSSTNVVIPLDSTTASVQPVSKPIDHVTAYHHVLLDHNYWLTEPVKVEPTAIKVEPEVSALPLPLTIELKPKVEVNNNKVEAETSPKIANCDNAVKKRWLRQATMVSPPETSPTSDVKAPPKKRRIVLDEDNEIKVADAIKIEEQLVPVNMIKREIAAFDFGSDKMKEIHEKIEMEFGRKNHKVAHNNNNNNNNCNNNVNHHMNHANNNFINNNNATSVIKSVSSGGSILCESLQKNYHEVTATAVGIKSPDRGVVIYDGRIQGEKMRNLKFINLSLHFVFNFINFYLFKFNN